jgi:hypothetical protein
MSPMKCDNALMIRWGLPPPGREHRALEVLRAMHAFFLGVQEAGRITGFQQFGYNTGPLHERAGFVILEGTKEQMQAFLYSDDFKQEVRRLALVTTNLSVDTLELGAAVKRRLDAWDASVQELKK